jgi:formiminotetrahydrofolate cyclodeaminase
MRREIEMIWIITIVVLTILSCIIAGMLYKDKERQRIVRRRKELIAYVDAIKKDSPRYDYASIVAGPLPKSTIGERIERAGAFARAFREWKDGSK